MGAPPPGDETIRLAVPALGREKRCHGLDQAGLHIDDGAVLVEDERLNIAHRHTSLSFNSNVVF